MLLSFHKPFGNRNIITVFHDFQEFALDSMFLRNRLLMNLLFPVILCNENEEKRPNIYSHWRSQICPLPNETIQTSTIKFAVKTYKFQLKVMGISVGNVLLSS